MQFYKRWLVCCLLIGLGCLPQGTAARVLISLPAQVQVDNPVLRLGDVAQISGDEPERQAALAEIRLGGSPLAGSHLQLTPELLTMRLQAAGADLTGIEWQVPPVVTVTAVAQQVTGEQLVAAAVQLIQQATKGMGGEVVTQPVLVPQDVQVPRGELRLQATLPYGIRYNIPTQVMVTVLVDGRQAAKSTVRLDVQCYQQIVVTARPLMAKDVLTADALRTERLAIGRLRPGYQIDVQKLVGLSVKRPVAPGTVLTNDMVAKPTLVKRGTLVTILAKQGALEVSATGQALQDGTEGQLIRVQNTLSKKIIAATVVDAATVQVGL